VPKRIHWNPLPKSKLINTIFTKLPECVVDFNLLNEFFCRHDSEIKAEEERVQIVVEAQKVLESKRIGDMAVCISSVKATAEEIVDAINNLDEYILDEDTLNKLIRICPT
jgi:hypothetical protein